MSFLKKLFGLGGAAEDGAPKPGKSIEYGGFTIRAEPYKSEGQFQTAGVIEKDVGGERKQHRFIRADRFNGLDDAVDCALSKGRQIIDERGDKVFD
ncbi:MAG: HlyU family transcriptional regulator [Parvibaculaceae bacterium]